MHFLLQDSTVFSLVTGLFLAVVLLQELTASLPKATVFPLRLWIYYEVKYLRACSKYLAFSFDEDLIRNCSGSFDDHTFDDSKKSG